MDETTSSLQILEFYGWWQMIYCFFACLGLLAIWFHIGRKQKDSGQVWLALSVLCWSLSGAIDLYYSAEAQQNIQAQLYADGARSIFSLLNSLFILLALPWFRYLPKILDPIIKSKYWKIIVGLPFLFSLLPTISKVYASSSGSLISELDVYYSILTLIILSYVLWESFTRRRLYLLAILSLVCMLITFTAQIYKMTDAQINQVLFSAIFKSSLIMIFFALALSWVKDLSEQLKLSYENVCLRFKKEKTSDSKFKHQVEISGVVSQTKNIELSPTHYALLEKFAQKRSKDEWLEIMPKADERTGKQYDIRDYNEVKRLLHKMLDEIFGKGSWTKDQHEIPFKEAMFERSENRDRKIRLRIKKENIFF